MARTDVFRGLHEPLFSVHEQLNEDPISPTIPDQPCVDSSCVAVGQFLQLELETPVLDELFPHLWFVAAQTSQRVDALHKQKVKGRRVVITEDPKLHLVWHSGIIYIKPIPHCLLNYEFWMRYICLPVDSHPEETSPHMRSALGFLRTYALLIRHPSDLRLALESRLMPGHIEWNRFARFIEAFRHLDDDQVSPRYHFGQLRLTRLNWAIRMFRPSSSPQWWYYHEIYWSTVAYIERFFGPLLFVFGSLAIILTAMQVVVSVPEGSILTTKQWTAVAKASWEFSITMILLIVVIWFAFLGGFIVFLIAQVAFSVKMRVCGDRMGLQDLSPKACKEMGTWRGVKEAEAGGFRH
ncbi:hypothetical protein MMC28_008891 [Mycoblastus sanguinarius]|nr:hypothetical protein [Mycoblastus sanguinarius]